MADVTGRMKTAVLACFAGALVFAAAQGCAPVCAADLVTTDYIVKYKGSVLRQDNAVPFDVVSEEEMRRLDAAGLLEWYEPDGEMTLFDDLVPPLYSDEKWDLSLIRADTAFENNYLGQNVRIGVLDSGINPHGDIAASLLAGRSYIEDGDANDTADTYGHGTHVAGLITGAGDNGYIGAAPGAKLVPLKVTDGKGVTVSTVCRAIYGGIDDYGCDVLNMSLGINSEYQSLKDAVAYAEERGVVIVSAAGNNGNTAKVYPAAYESVIGVGAVDSDGTWFYHSNHNDSVLLTAPGVNVKTVGKYGGYELKSGTSFSVPLVTAAAAVMLSIDGTLTPSDVRTILAKTATDKGTAGFDEYYGAGLLDIGGCVGYLTGHACRFLPVMGAASQIQNTTNEDLDCTYLLAQYDENGVCRKIAVYDVTIPAKGVASVEAPPENTAYGQFVLEKGKLKPLAIAKRSR